MGGVLSHDLPAALALAPLLLAAVLAWSASFKLADSASTQSAILQLRLPRTWSKPAFAIALPVGEIVLAAALLIPARWFYVVAAVAAVVLFAAYFVVIARALTFDPRPACGCFGRMGGSRVTPATLVRNALLLIVALAAGVAALAGQTVWSLLGSGSGTAGWWVLGAAVAASAATLIVAGPRDDAAPGSSPAPSVRPGKTSHALEAEVAKPVSSPGSDPDADDDLEDYLRTDIPRATLQRGDGTMTTLRELASARAQVLVAVNCTCGPTVGAARRLDAWRKGAPAIDVRFVSTISPQLIHRITDVDEVLYDHAAVAWQALHIQSSPAAVLLGADGQLAGGPVHGLDEIEDFLAEIAIALAEGVAQQPPLE